MNKVNMKSRQQVEDEFDPFQSDNSYQSDEDNQPVIMNFLEDIKGHLEGDISFETNEHDIYDPAFSQTISHRIKDHQDTAFQKQKFKSNVQSIKSCNSINIICSLEIFQQQLEFKHTQSLPDQQNLQKLSNSKQQQLNFLWGKIRQNNKDKEK
ncbi:unnamed protein product (macronuclear) [Paramecium tetraurelia]|uniref:Uncharacterized protein n=1 Tax=Paramecium tetraurelia TaxID=5888 RepID=A0DQ06_PARTE|nr:uncharacterized protein GSPATT00002523001 [Paramecium tetraurelia]CAK85123.1 unnamed protein product [Paramecium tetraurelia]|eukprot:XP_001452520.1 hypothetical protein (macronuclear) [Paramecium tetraurelia strain d4-2]